MTSPDVFATPVFVQRWPSEGPLRLFVLLVSILSWIALTLTVIGLLYALLIGAFLFFGHLVFIAYLRGNAVRLGPRQMPELYRRVESLARKVGLAKVPEAYLLQSGGVLNALATRFRGADFIVLYSDLLDACGDNEDARDFIVTHELGHLAAGHLRWRWLLMPGLMTPFLGHAYSRACEYTSDRYGSAGVDRRPGAVDGLCILAAGGKQGRQINPRALAAQRLDLAGGWMTIGRWLSSHPPIAYRVAELDPGLASGAVSSARGAVSALALISLFALLPALALAAFVAFVVPRFPSQARREPQVAAAPPQAAPRPAGAATAPAPQDDLRGRVERDILALVERAEAHRSSAGELPADADALYAAWSAAYPSEAEPLDPYNGQRYGYGRVQETDFVIWSSGPDMQDQSDDLYYFSQAAAAAIDPAPGD